MKHQWKPLLLVAYVFICTGVIICMNDVLLPSLKDFFHLSYLQASFVQQSFYLVYLIFPIPIAYYISRFGYRASLVTALIVCGCGAMLFLPAYLSSSYAFCLLALFVISVGVTVVNVAANPLAALLGDPSGAHVRVNFVQLFSRIGYSITPIMATKLMYSGNGKISFHIPYLVLAGGTILLAILIGRSVFPNFKPELLKGFSISSIIRDSKQYPKLFLGAITMFFYVGAEACTAGFFSNYLKDVAGFSTDRAAQFLTYYYVAAGVMSVVGMYLLRLMSAGRLVAIFGIGMICMYALAAYTTSALNPFYLVGMGVFISIIFPSVFSLGIEGIGSFTEKGSALINMAVVGGAVFPPLQGMLADAYGIQISYVVPGVCFLIIVCYGIFCDRYKSADKQFYKAF